MEILHFKEFDDAESVDTNAVWVFTQPLKCLGDTERRFAENSCAGSVKFQ